MCCGDLAADVYMCVLPPCPQQQEVRRSGDGFGNFGFGDTGASPCLQKVGQAKGSGIWQSKWWGIPNAQVILRQLRMLQVLLLSFCIFEDAALKTMKKGITLSTLRMLFASAHPQIGYMKCAGLGLPMLTAANPWMPSSAK